MIRKPKKKVKKEENKNLIVGLVLLLVGLGSYYHFVLNVPEAEPEVVEAPLVPEVPVTETEFLSKSVLDSLYKNNSCKDNLASWCADARIVSSQKEGAVIESKALILYLNMDAFINEEHAESFNSLDLNKRLEILALRRIFNSNVLRSFLRQKQLDTLQVVAGTIKEDQFSPFVAFKFKRDLDEEKIEKFTIFSLFDQILNEGKDEALIDISLLYDKLDF